MIRKGPPHPARAGATGLRERACYPWPLTVPDLARVSLGSCPTAVIWLPTFDGKAVVRPAFRKWRKRSVLSHNCECRSWIILYIRIIH